VDLLHRVVPILLGLQLGGFDFFRDGIFRAALFISGGNELDRIPRARGHNRPHGNRFVVREGDVIEFDLELAGGAEIRIQRSFGAHHFRRPGDPYDAARNGCADGNHDLVKCVDGFNQTAMHGLAHMHDANVLVDCHDQRGALGNRQRYEGTQGSRGWVRRSQRQLGFGRSGRCGRLCGPVLSDCTGGADTYEEKRPDPVSDEHGSSPCRYEC
jgi:hypothetical protein